MSNLKDNYPLDVVLFSSPKYWEEKTALAEIITDLHAQLSAEIGDDSGELIKFHWVFSAIDAAGIETFRANTPVLFVPLSGGVQRWMLELSRRCDIVCILNAYLPDFGLPHKIGTQLLKRNAHPACTDLFSFLRMQERRVFWLSSMIEFREFWTAWQCVERLRHSRLLQVGETEPWVINSCQNPKRFRQVFGTEIDRVTKDELYSRIKEANEDEVQALAKKWLDGSRKTGSISPEDVTESARTAVGLQRLLSYYEANGIALACFSMIHDLNTTACMAFGHLNQQKEFIAACEGDLDAAITMLILRTLGADYIWMGNPIIHRDNRLDLVHCSASMGTGVENFEYSLNSHHESGKGVSPVVKIPAQRSVTMCRIGNDLNDMLICRGLTAGNPKLPTCRTQSTIKIESSESLVNNLLGTHIIASFGDFRPELRCLAKLLNLRKLEC